MFYINGCILSLLFHLLCLKWKAEVLLMQAFIV